MEKSTRHAHGPAKRTGGCHCGAVRYEVMLDLGTGGSQCNCSVCTKIAPTSGMVKPDAFKLLEGEANLTEYVWGMKISHRFFCKTCGVHSFARGHLAELGGDYVAINLNTIDDLDLLDVKVIYWDGRHNNWQAGPRSTPWPLASAEAAEAATK